jgi:hypothetical protein
MDGFFVLRRGGIASHQVRNPLFMQEANKSVDFIHIKGIREHAFILLLLFASVLVSIAQESTSRKQLLPFWITSFECEEKNKKI